MSAYTLKVNGRAHQLDVDPNTPLLWPFETVSA